MFDTGACMRPPDRRTAVSVEARLLNSLLFSFWVGPRLGLAFVLRWCLFSAGAFCQFRAVFWFRRPPCSLLSTLLGVLLAFRLGTFIVHRCR